MPLPLDMQYCRSTCRSACRGEPFDLDRDLHDLRTRAMNLCLVVLLAYGMLVTRAFGGPWAGGSPSC